MHLQSVLHVRDHSKATGPAHHLLEFISTHTNAYTGEAFELTVDRIAHRLGVTSQWVGQLRQHLLAAGELILKQSRGRRPNVYIIPYARCLACQTIHPHVRGEEEDSTLNVVDEEEDSTPNMDGTDDFNPKVEFGVEDSNPQVTPNQPPSNPKVAEASEPELARLAPPKDVIDVKKKEHLQDVNVADRRWEQVAQAVNAAHTEGFLDQVAEALQDWKPLSRRTYRQHLAEFGEAVMWRRVCYVREAFIDGLVKTSPGAYYMGVVRAERARG